MAEAHGVKETLELLSSLSALVDAVDEVLADGKLSLGDVAVIPGLILALKPGVEGISSVKDELSELSKEELQQVLAGVVDLAVKIGEKFK